eukprot:scaffold67958_cov20-Tisochrysis_lutea.AAC.4
MRRSFLKNRSSRGEMLEKLARSSVLFDVLPWNVSFRGKSKQVAVSWTLCCSIGSGATGMGTMYPEKGARFQIENIGGAGYG